jgi:hypothetical protein
MANLHAEHVDFIFNSREFHAEQLHCIQTAKLLKKVYTLEILRPVGLFPTITGFTILTVHTHTIDNDVKRYLIPAAEKSAGFHSYPLLG